MRGAADPFRKLISCLLCVLTDIHSEPHHPFKFLINRCFSVSPHQKVELRSRATMCWSSVSFSLSLGRRKKNKKTAEVCNFYFFLTSMLCECVSEACQKVCDMSGWRRGTAGRPSTLIEYWRSFEFSFPLGCSLRELAQRDKQHVLQD